MNKYKVKNTVTGEETICEKVVVDGYDFYYTKEFPKNGDYGLTKLNTITKIGYAFEFGLYKKVIATTNKSLDLPMVIDEVEELAEKHAKSMWGVYYDDIDEDCNDTRGNNSINDYKHGYQRAKETYSFTKEDMVEFTEWLITKSFREGTSDYTTSELLDLWQEQRTIEILVK